MRWLGSLLCFAMVGWAASPPAHAQDNPETLAPEAQAKTKKRKKKPKPPAPTPAAPQAEVPAKPGVATEAPVAQSSGGKAAESGGFVAAAPLDLLPELTDTTPPAKVAITSFAVEGDEVPAALVYQLQDGFILGLVRAGVRVIDTDDLKHRLKDDPDLLTCDTSPCLKRLGQAVAVRHIVRVQVQVTGNSYRMSARIYRTTGAAPAAMPVETQSRFCDVCTVTEARETMLRLADGIRVPDEPGLVDLSPAPAPLPRLSKKPAIGAMVAGGFGIVLGTVILATAGDRDKGRSAVGGGLMGAGALSAVAGIFFYADAAKVPPAPVAATPGP